MSLHDSEGRLPADLRLQDELCAQETSLYDELKRSELLFGDATPEQVDTTILEWRKTHIAPDVGHSVLGQAS